MVTKKIKKVSKNIKILCKKYSIRLTIKRGSKRIKKSLCILLRELKKKIKGTKSTKRSNFGKRRRRRFGEGEENVAVQGKKANLFKRAGSGIKNKAIVTGNYAKANPKKFAAMVVGGVALAGLAAVVGPALLAGGAAASTTAAAGTTAVVGASEALTAGTTALTLSKKGLQGAQGAHTILEKEKQLSNAAKALSTAQKGLSAAAEGTGKALDAVQEGVNNLEKVKQTLNQVKALVPNDAVQNAQDGLQEIEKQAAQAAFGKRRKRTRFGEIFKNYPQFGKSSFGHSNYTPKQQVMNFGMTPKKAMEIIRKLYRKNCKNV